MLLRLVMRLLGGQLVRESLAQARRAVLFWALALILAMVAVLAILALGWLVLFQHYGPVVATLALLAVAVILALVSVLLALLSTGSARRLAPRPAVLDDLAANPLAALIPKSIEQAVATAFLVAAIGWLIGSGHDSGPDKDPKA